MKKMILAVILFSAINGYAAQTNTGCQGNCPTSGGDTINQGGVGYGGQGGNGGSAIASAVGIGVGVGGAGGSGGSGGAGGAGGAGGSVVGSGNSSATGGAVVGSGNSKQDQSQGQHQVANGGNAKQSQSSRNDNRSSANNTNSNANSGNNAQTSVSVTGDAVTYQAARIPVATAYAPNIAPTALCALGVSAGGQGMSFGFSIGGSYIDTNCQNLEQVRTAAAVLGDRETAAEMMCGISEAYREARDRSGKPCGKAKSLAATDEKITMAAAKKPEYTDPIVRARLGLPPLK